MMDPLAFRDYIGISLCYLLFLWPVHLIIGGVGTLVASVLYFVRRQWSKAVLKASWLFTGLLLCFGFAFNFIWNVGIFNKLYWAYDYAGWECSPFKLIIHGVSALPAQYAHGMTEGSIHGLWLIYAALSWGSATWFTYKILKKKNVEPSVAGYRRQGISA